MSNQRMTRNWGASLPQQPLQPGRGTGSTSDLVQSSGKQTPVVPKVQHDLVAHLQRAFPILEPSIVQLIVDESGEGGISDAVKTLSSLAADAETEAASSSSPQGSIHPMAKQLGSPSSNCVDDNVAMDMAIAASLADQKVQRSVSNERLQVETADSGCWDAESGWETIDPAVAAEWGAPPPLVQSNTISTGSGLGFWDDIPVQSTAPVPRGTEMPPAQSEGSLVASWGTDWTPPETASREDSPKALNEQEAAKEPGAQAMAAILGENWAKEPLWNSSAGYGDLTVENRDPALGRSTLQAVKGKTTLRPYAPRIAIGAGKEEGKRPYSPKVLIDRIVLETNAVATHDPPKESLSKSTETFETIRSDLPEDGEAEVLRQLKAMFPDVADSVICKAYIDSESDANKAAEALCQTKEATLNTIEGTAALKDCSTFAPISWEGKPPSSGKPEKSLDSFQDNLLHDKGANPDPGPKHNLVPSRQHPNPFTEDDSDSEHPTASRGQLVSPMTATSSSRGTSPLSSSVTSPATSPRSRKKGKKDVRRVTGTTSSSSSSDDEAKNTRRDMVDFMVSMLGGSVPVAVVADVIENLKGDFQQSMKCLLSMSAGSEGGLIGEEFGAMVDGSDGAGDLSESPSRPSSDGEEEDPGTTLLNIFGADKKETIHQVLKEKGGNVGDAATVLMAMFESETGASSGDDLARLQLVEDEPVVEEDDSEDPTKINVEQLMAHFPLADKSAVRSLLRINNNSFEDTAKMLYDSGLMPRGLDVASLSDHQAAQPTYAERSERSHFSQHQPFQIGSLVAGTRARPVTPPYGSGTKPPGGYYEEPSFHQPRAHLQPLFRSEEFPEIGREMPVFSEAPDDRAPVQESHNSLFLKNRSATNKHWRACQYYFAEAARARANREFSRAEALKEQGRKHKRLAEAANQVASSKIFSEKNKTIRNSVKIDVHGQLVQEALGHVDDHLKSLSNLTTISYLSIITGRGLHSENGKAKILPAVQKYLRERGYTFYQENPGCIVVDLKAERQVPNSLSSAEDADSRPSSAESYEERPGRLEGAGNGQASYRKLNLA